MRKPTTRADRKAQFAHRCAYCGNRATTIDHVVPTVRGGVDDPSNWVPCCGRCNSSKGAKDAYTWFSAQDFFLPQRWATIEMVLHSPDF